MRSPSGYNLSELKNPRFLQTILPFWWVPRLADILGASFEIKVQAGEQSFISRGDKLMALNICRVADLGNISSTDTFNAAEKDTDLYGLMTLTLSVDDDFMTIHEMKKEWMIERNEFWRYTHLVQQLVKLCLPYENSRRWTSQSFRGYTTKDRLNQLFDALPPHSYKLYGGSYYLQNFVLYLKPSKHENSLGTKTVLHSKWLAEICSRGIKEKELPTFKDKLL